MYNFWTVNDDMSEVLESSIATNTHATCSIMIPFSKSDRDYSVFGEYTVVLGARIWNADATTPYV